jgi:hypothetical protein
VPVPVAVAGALWLALAVTFVVIPIIANRYGQAAQRAAEAEVARQGVDTAVLVRHKVQFTESAKQMLFPFAIAACLAALAAITLAGLGQARILSWIAAPIVLLAVGFVSTAQVFAGRYVEAAFRRSDDAAVHHLDARAVIGAARGAFPAPLRPLQILRLALATLGSVAIVVLLATPEAGAYFG